MTESKTKSLIERYLTEGIAAVILTFVLWIGYTVNEGQKTSVKLSSQLESLEKLVVLQMADRYTGSEGDALEKRVNALELKLNVIQQEQSRRTSKVYDTAEQFKDHMKDYHRTK